MASDHYIGPQEAVAATDEPLSILLQQYAAFQEGVTNVEHQLTAALADKSTTPHHPLPAPGIALTTGKCEHQPIHATKPFAYIGT